MSLRTLIAQKLCCFFDSALERCSRQPRPAVVHLLKSVTISKHSDDLGNCGASAVYGEFSTCAVRTSLKVFVLHSMSILASTRQKVKYFKGLGNFEKLVIPKVRPYNRKIHQL